jgi:hypothetical protein
LLKNEHVVLDFTSENPPKLGGWWDDINPSPWLTDMKVVFGPIRGSDGGLIISIPLNIQIFRAAVYIDYSCLTGKILNVRNSSVLMKSRAETVLTSPNLAENSHGDTKCPRDEYILDFSEKIDLVKSSFRINPQGK